MKEKILAKLTPDVKERLNQLHSVFKTLKRAESAGRQLTQHEVIVVDSYVRKNESDPISHLWPLNVISCGNIISGEARQVIGLELFNRINVREFFEIYTDLQTAINDYESLERRFSTLSLNGKMASVRWMCADITMDPNLHSKLQSTDADRTVALKHMLEMECELFTLWNKHN